VKRVADGQADIEDRLETCVRVSPALDEAAKGPRVGPKGAEVGRMAGGTAGIDDLLRERRQLNQQLASLA